MVKDNLIVEEKDKAVEEKREKQKKLSKKQLSQLEDAEFNKAYSKMGGI